MDPLTLVPSVKEQFERFADRECAGSSPLYESLARGIAKSPALLALAERAPAGQPVPNLFLAAVHFLLLRGNPHQLRACYADLTSSPDDGGAALPRLLDFCESHADAIAAIMATRVVNTNEVARCACLLPAFARVGNIVGGRLHFIEVGASAGLNLLFPHYRYEYFGAPACGAIDSPLSLACEVRGRPLPDIVLPRVGETIGIDLHSLDVRDEADVMWLRALIWPEHRARAERLARAIEIAHRFPPVVRRGDGVALVSEVARGVPYGEPLCVFHSFTLNQFSPQARRSLGAVLDDLATARPVYRVGLEWGDEDAPVLSLTHHGERRTTTRLARCDAHGSWISWEAPA